MHIETKSKGDMTTYHQSKVTPYVNTALLSTKSDFIAKKKGSKTLPDIMKKLLANFISRSCIEIKSHYKLLVLTITKKFSYNTATI